MNNLWEKIGNACLKRAEELLEKETVTTAATAETVKCLVETAISIDMLNLRWEEQSRYGAAVLRISLLYGHQEKIELTDMLN